MGAQAIAFAGSFAAVAVLVLVVHFAGFSRLAKLQNEQEARELASLTPGGFEVAQIALDREAAAHWHWAPMAGCCCFEHTARSSWRCPSAARPWNARATR